jgi:hypothetical protein
VIELLASGLRGWKRIQRRIKQVNGPRQSGDGSSRSEITSSDLVPGLQCSIELSKREKARRSGDGAPPGREGPLHLDNLSAAWGASSKPVFLIVLKELAESSSPKESSQERDLLVNFKAIETIRKLRLSLSLEVGLTADENRTQANYLDSSDVAGHWERENRETNRIVKFGRKLYPKLSIDE